MSARVVGPLAIVRVAGVDMYLSRGDMVPLEADEEHLAHLVRMGLVDVDDVEADGDGGSSAGKATGAAPAEDEAPVKRGPGRPRKSDN